MTRLWLGKARNCVSIPGKDDNFSSPKPSRPVRGPLILPIQGRREYSGCGVKLSTHIHHEWSCNSIALRVVTACIEAALPLLCLSLKSYKNKLQMMQRASSLTYHHETCRNKKMLWRCWENRNPVLSFQTLTFDFTMLPYVVFSLNPYRTNVENRVSS